MLSALNLFQPFMIGSCKERMKGSWFIMHSLKACPSVLHFVAFWLHKICIMWDCSELPHFQAILISSFRSLAEKECFLGYGVGGSLHYNQRGRERGGGLASYPGSFSPACRNAGDEAKGPPPTPRRYSD